MAQNYEKTFDFLKKRTQVNFVSTINGDVPSCRPFGDPVFFDGKIYALTMKNKDVSKQIAINPNVCIVAYDGESWIRVNCKMIDDSDNIEAKKAVMAEFEWAEEEGYNLENPDFQLLYLAEAKATCYNEDSDVLWTEEF